MSGNGEPRTRLAALLAAALGAAALSAAPPAGAAGRRIDDILVTRSGREATVDIRLACPMRVESDLATDAGTVVEVHLSPLEGCREFGAGELASEVYRPTGGGLAGLAQVEYESLGVGEDFIVLRFAQRVDYRVGQRGNLRGVELALRLPETFEESARPPAVVDAPAGEAAAPASTVTGDGPAGSGARRSAERGPVTVRVREPDTTGDYVVNLQSTRELPDAALVAALPVAGGERLYVSDIRVDGVAWHRLRLGFFASEAAAHAALAPLAQQFPRAWIGRAEPREVTIASAGDFARGGVVEAAVLPGHTATAASSAARGGAAAAAVRAAAATASIGSTGATGATGAEAADARATEVPAGTAPLSDEAAASLLADARAATLDGDFDEAVRLYSQALAGTGTQGATARELLGVAFEKSGRPGQARAEYRAYLERYPSAPGAARVRQRLNGLLTASAAPPTSASGVIDVPEASDEVSGRAEWDVSTSLAQYYERTTDQFDADQAETVTLSALVSDLDLGVARTGGNIDVLGRITVNHLYDLLGEGESGLGDRSRLYYAYADVGGAAGGWSVRLGRQSLHHFGVLGRFDGAHVRYDWAPDRRLHVTAGYPVESPRRSLEPDRRFEGVAVDFDHLLGGWDFTAFLNRQTILGLDDRQAAGFEVAYRGERRSLNGIVDYDVGYAKLNTLLALGTWRLADRATLSALVDLRMSPVLTTRNALIGQPVSGFDELLLAFTEEEIRQLALDRTAESRTATLGIATPLGERFQLNADVSVTELGATVASAGVPALPDNGTQTVYSMSFVGSGLFGGRDVSIFSLRYGEADTFTTSQLTWDSRFALGRALRINPRLRYSTWESAADGRLRETLSPSLRLLVDLRHRYRLELELGSNEITRTSTGDRQMASGTFLSLGYRADF